MWHEMLVQQIPLAEKVIRTVVVYALIVVLFRLTGKRGLAGLNSLDLVVMFLLSNVVQNAIIGNDNSLTGGLIGAVTLVVINALVNRGVLHSRWLTWLVDGTDTAVIQHGTVLAGVLRRLGLRPQDLDHAVRLQNGDAIAQVDTGVLEASGHLLLTLKPAEQGATKGDVTALLDRLERIESLLVTGPRP